MEKLTIKAPEGYEFSGVSDNGEIEFVPIKKKYPLSVKDIEGRTWYLNGFGSVCDIAVGDIASKDINNVSTKERAEAILALTQLLELRDAWNRVDGFVVDWTDSSQNKFVIVNERNKPALTDNRTLSHPLFFGSYNTSLKFLNEFATLIETAKELL